MSSKIDIMLEVKGELIQMREQLNKNTTELAVYNVQLKEHIEGVKLARAQNDLLKEDIDNRLEPIQKHVHHVEGALKLLGILSIIGGLIKLML